MQFIFWQVLIRRIKAIPAFLRDKTVPKRKKAVILFGIFYLLMPIDLIPAPILIFGFVDDIVLWGFIIHYFRKELDTYWLGVKEVKPEKRFRGKKIINGVSFEVKDDVGEEKDKERQD